MAYIFEDDSNTDKASPINDVSDDEELLSIESEREKFPEESLTFSKIKSKAFGQIFGFSLLAYIPFIAGGIFIPLYGAQWFGGCLINNKNLVDPECKPNYSKFAFFSTLFQSIGGLIAFIFSAFIGRLTDSYGRKKFYMVGILCWMIPRTMMCFYVNFYIYFTIAALADLNANELAVKGAIADIIPSEKRTNAFGKIHIASGIGLIIGTIFAVVISTVYDNHTIFYALTVWYGILILYVLIFVNETIDINNNRRHINLKNAFKNPLRPLKYAFQNKIILFVSFGCLLISLCDSGIISTLFPYIGTEMQLYDDGKSTLIYGLYVVILSISMAIFSGIILPMMQKKFTDITIICIAISVKIIALLLLISIAFYPNIVVLMLSACFFGGSFFCWPTFDGLISKCISKSCQGTAFGIRTSYTQLAAIFGPFSFGYLYVALDKAHLPYIFIIMAIFVCVIAIILVSFPLKREVNKIYSIDNQQKNQQGVDNFVIDGKEQLQQNPEQIAMVRLISDKPIHDTNTGTV